MTDRPRSRSAGDVPRATLRPITAGSRSAPEIANDMASEQTMVQLFSSPGSTISPSDYSEYDLFLQGLPTRLTDDEGGLPRTDRSARIQPSLQQQQDMSGPSNRLIPQAHRGIFFTGGSTEERTSESD